MITDKGVILTGEKYEMKRNYLFSNRSAHSKRLAIQIINGNEIG